jgi:hypothetical protein
MSRNDHSSAESTRIVFNKDGSIADVPQNELLLRQIVEMPPLSPSGLFKLMTFFLKYPTNRPLAQHLALFGYSSFVRSLKAVNVGRRPESITLATGNEANDEPDRLWPGGPVKADWLDGWDEPGRDELSENPFAVRLQRVTWIPYSGVGLLVETIKHVNTDTLAFYVVGVCPDPASLPED